MGSWTDFKCVLAMDDVTKLAYYFDRMHSIVLRWQLITRILSFAGAICGLVGLAFTLRPLTEWGMSAYIWLAVALALLLVGVIFEVYAETSRTVFAKSDHRGIRDYMYNWIQHGGSVAIWTRDHTWVNDDEMRNLLLAKAQRNELTFCVPRTTAFTGQLGDAGADVVVHSFSNPAVRFTITQYGKDTFAVALARPSTRCHVIEEYSNGDPSAALARDLVELAKAHRKVA